MATVITNLFSVVPIYGTEIVTLLWGAFNVGNATLNRFFSLHYLLPFGIAALTLIHMAYVHKDGSNNPLGINGNIDKIPFYPYFYIKDLYSVTLFAIFFSFFIFFAPNILGQSMAVNGPKAILIISLFAGTLRNINKNIYISIINFYSIISVNIKENYPIQWQWN